MPRPPRRRALEGGCPHAASRLARLALLGLISPVGDGLPGPDHGGAEIHLARKADRDGAAVAVLLARPAAKLAALGKGFQEARRRPSAGPRVAGAHAGLPEFRRIDAVEPDFDAGDADAVAVDHLRGTDDVGGAPLRDQAGGGEAGQSQAGEQPCGRGYALFDGSPRPDFFALLVPFLFYPGPTLASNPTAFARPKAQWKNPSAGP